MTEIEQTKRMLFHAEILSGDRLHRAEAAEARADQQADRAGHFETLYHKQLLTSKAAEARVLELELHIELSDDRRAAIEAATIERCAAKLLETPWRIGFKQAAEIIRALKAK